MNLSMKHYKTLRTIAIVGVVVFGGITMWSGVAEVMDRPGPGDFGDISAGIGVAFLLMMMFLPSPEEPPTD